MSKVKVKKIKIPITSKDEGLAEMFNQMLGTGSVNITIAYPRYKKIKTLCVNIVKIFNELVKSPFMRTHPDFVHQRIELEQYVAHATAQIETLFCMDLEAYEWNLTLVENELRQKFSEVYDAVKRSDLVNQFVVMCDRLVPYKANFADLQKLHHFFIVKMPGVEWCPFPFSSLNLKYIFAMPEVKANTTRFIMTILHTAYKLSYALYEELQAPDIDVDEFVDFIMKNIDEIQKRPELHRCRDAFQKIKESVKLLKDRFNGYYRDFVATKDSTIMMQHFITDVSKSTAANAKVTAQFRTIIAYYRKVAQSQITNPKIKMLLDKVDESFNDLERGTENLVNIRDLSEDDDSHDSDPILATPISAADLNIQ